MPDVQNLLFVLKKIMTAAIVPPGLVILLLIVFAFVVRRLKAFTIGAAVLLYLVSIEPAKDALLRPLENAVSVPVKEEIRNCQAYIILGGGIVDGTPEMDFKGNLGTDSYPRVLSAFLLYRTDPKPIVPTGGKRPQQKRSEAELTREILLSMGVDRRHIYLNTPSRDADTMGNALYARSVLSPVSITRVVVVTSAYHAKRSQMIFNRFFDSAVVFPTGYKTGKREYRYASFLPDANNILGVAVAVKEYLGIAFYKMKL
jgi:uncharacterized SAM-binding protein YcdF (DUF218 family)